MYVYVCACKCLFVCEISCVGMFLLVLARTLGTLAQVKGLIIKVLDGACISIDTCMIFGH